MTKLLSLTAASTLFLASTAFAGEMKPTEKMTATTSTQTLANGAKIVTIDNQPTAVLGVIDRDGETLYRIADEDGNEFLNFVPDNLPEVTTDIDVIDEYTYEYRGITFTNRVVAENGSETR